jgi:hypothetical protein
MLKLLQSLTRSAALMLALLFWGTAALAQTAPQDRTTADIRLELLQQLQQDGFLSDKMAQEARLKYVDPKAVNAPVAQDGPPAAPSLWERYVSWVNFFKVTAVLLLLVAFSGAIAKLGRRLKKIILLVPTPVYQAALLSASVYGTFAAADFLAAQAYYLRLFCAFSNLILLGWVFESSLQLKALLARLLKAGLPLNVLACAAGMLYFGALAIFNGSTLLGFIAVIFLSGVFSFGVSYAPGVLTLFFAKNRLAAVILGHLLVLGTYAGLKISGALPPESALFAAGLEYYGTVALGVGFLVGTSPFGKKDAAAAAYFFLFLLTLTLIAAITGYFFFDLKVIGTIMCFFGLLLALEWIGFLSHKVGFLPGAAIMGAVLYGVAMLLEANSHLIIFRIT